MELVNNDRRLLLVTTPHKNITSISNTLVCLNSGFIWYEMTSIIFLLVELNPKNNFLTFKPAFKWNRQCVTVTLWTNRLMCTRYTSDTKVDHSIKVSKKSRDG